MASVDQPINLHTLPDFFEIVVSADLRLVPLNKAHGIGLLKILARDPSIRNRVTVASRMHTLEDIQTEIDSFLNDAGLIRFTLLKGSVPIGMASFWRDDGFWGEKNLDDYGFGFFLDPSERGQGFVTKSLEALIKLASRRLHVRQFVAFCEDNNVSSISVLKKLGFEPTNETFSEPNKGWIERKYILMRN